MVFETGAYGHVPTGWQRRAKLASPMSDRAFVYLRRRNDRRPRFLGLVGVRPRPAKGAQVQLFFRGKVERGRVIAVSPDYWGDQIGVTPTLHVIQDEPK